jgi:tetratricopeptide (TPR) repeat protein
MIDGSTLETAGAAFQSASNQGEVMQVIQMYESILVKEPDNLSAMVRLSHLHIYKGAALETSRSGKRSAFLEAMAYAEEAMMQFPAFREEIENGSEIWDAAEVLDKAYVPAIGFWSIAIFYQFDECLSKVVKPFNLKWIHRAESMLAKAYQLEPTWAAGQLDFSYGIIYLMPKAAGGDMEKSKAYFDKAVDAYPNWLINRWGRARYYYKKTGEKDAQRADIDWVLAQDPASAPGPLFWNLYFQEQARQLLED